MQILAVHRRAALAHLRVEHHAHGVGAGMHRQRDAHVANHGSDDVAGPAAVGRAVRRAATQADRRGVNRFLTQRPESFALEGGAPKLDLAAGEQRLQPRIGRAREQHAAQNLAPLVGVQRRLDRRAAEESVARVDEVGVRLRDARLGRGPRRRVRQARRQRARVEAPRQLAAERFTERIEIGVAHRGTATRDGLERIDRVGQREGIPFGDERAEVARQARQLVDPRRLRHSMRIVSKRPRIRFSSWLRSFVVAFPCVSPIPKAR